MLKDPANMRMKRLFIPEGVTDPKRELDQMSMSTKRKYNDKAMELDNPMRANSAQNTMKEGLAYKFKLADLSKYS